LAAASPIGGNDLGRFVSMTPDGILEEIRKESRIEAELARPAGLAPGHPPREVHTATVTKPR
jgi:hypothetical protein